MNALRMMTSKWVLAIGIAVRIITAASVSQAAPPGHDARGDGFRGQPDGGRQVYVDHSRDDRRGDSRSVYLDRDARRDNDGRGRFDGPAWRGGFVPAPGFVAVPAPVPAPYCPPLVCGGVGPAGLQVTVPGINITVNIR